MGCAYSIAVISAENIDFKFPAMPLRYGYVHLQRYEYIVSLPEEKVQS